MSFSTDESQPAPHSSAADSDAREAVVSPAGMASAAVATNSAPPPLVPAEVVLRNFSYMPLDVVRLRNSDMAAQENPAVCWFAVLLWSAAWHQTPAASLPDDDRVLAGIAGFGRDLKPWKKVRRGALRGWVKCSDGRLYHPVIAALALEAFDKKLNFQFKTELARIKKAAQRGGFSPDFPNFDEWILCYRKSGSPQFLRIEPFVPGDTTGTVDFVPAVHPSKGKERKGKEERAFDPNITESVKISERASAIARSLEGKGYSDCAASHPDVILMAEQSVSEGEIAEATSCKAARSFLGGMKGLTWVRRRIEGRRQDAAAPAGIDQAKPADPIETAKRDSARTLGDRLIELQHWAQLGTITPEQRQAKEADARAAHASQLAQLGVPQ